MLKPENDEVERHFGNTKNYAGGGPIAVKAAKDRLRNVCSFLTFSGGVSNLPISATILMRSNSNGGRKKIRESSLGFRVLLGLKLRRRISRDGFLPVVSFISAFILFIVVVISVLAPSPIELKADVRSDSKQAAVFSFPVSGWRLERDLWSSKSSDSYYGCCNASNEYHVFTFSKFGASVAAPVVRSWILHKQTSAKL